jgi:hypothetical protein
MTAFRDPILAQFDRPWDEQSPRYGKVAGDRNTYSAGAFGRHNVVLVHMHGMGKSSAAAASSSCRFSFPNIRLARRARMGDFCSRHGRWT